jgi:hypothetical protein
MLHINQFGPKASFAVTEVVIPLAAELGIESE